MKTAAALGLAAALMAGAAAAQTGETAATPPQALGDITGTWAVFWAGLTDTGAVIAFTGAMDVAPAGEGRWDIAISNYVLDTQSGAPSLVNARQTCEGIETDNVVAVTCTVTETSADGDYGAEQFTLTRATDTMLKGTLRESGGGFLDGLEALKAR